MRRPNTKVIAGIDLHGNNVVIGLIEQDGKRIEHQKVDTDLDQVAGTIYWGNQQYPIPLGGLAAKGNGKYLYTKGAGQGDPSVAYVMIDLNKCTFKIGLKNTTMTWQESPVDLRLQLGNFDQTDEAEF